MTDEQALRGTITLLVTMTFKPEKEQEFLDFAASIVEKVGENEPGTLLYVLTRHPSRPDTYVWVERYRDEAAMDAHRTATYMANVRPFLAEVLAGPVEALRLDQVLPG